MTDQTFPPGNHKAQEPLQGEVTADLDGARFDKAAAVVFHAYSRGALKRLILSGELTVNGGARAPEKCVFAGEILSCHALPRIAEPVPAPANDIALNIVHADAHIAVINKPAGLVVHPGAGNPGGTLLNALLARFPETRELPRAGIVHRLDKDTTGVMVVARTLPAYTTLVRALQERRVTREYMAVCNGVLTGGGTVDAPVGRHPVNRIKMAVTDRGKPAVTRYRILQRFRRHTLVRLSLETGRTHQIRVHMSHTGHPLTGDRLYGARPSLPPGATPELTATVQSFHRQALHAERLELHHPHSNELQSFTVPVPEDFAQLVHALHSDTFVPGE